jgi:hypothetical protein
MNLVERWFGHLDHKAIRRGVFLSVADLQAAIEAFLTAWNTTLERYDSALLYKTASRTINAATDGVNAFCQSTSISFTSHP